MRERVPVSADCRWGGDVAEAARADVFRYVEVEYNRIRLRRHPCYGYV
ncbi:hypothetical protein [Streptomyces sp. NPDC047042]